ncbi:transmembrane protein 45B-like [Clavelina lepadiformis]|uniref:transmembrane protein 45B-like n=1 Tax=Clavelina lepadiformis TaxID=159417 RepID=UPI0040419610
MGSFMGHILPGVLFIFYGMWLAFKNSYRHFVKKRSSNRRCLRLCTVNNAESIMLIVLPCVGIFLEQLTNHGPKFHLTNSSSEYFSGNNWSHSTMYLFFAFVGVADLLQFKVPQFVPRGIRDLMLCLALLIEGYLFYFHTHGRPELDVRIHVLLLLAIWGGAMTSGILGVLEAIMKDTDDEKSNNNSHKKSNEGFIELKNQEHESETALLGETKSNEYTPILTEDGTNNLSHEKLSPEFLALTVSLQKILKQIVAPDRCEKSHLQIILRQAIATSIFLQGTWFCQVAAILYPPGKEAWEVNHTNVHFATIFFAWHLAAAIFLNSAVHLTMYALTCRKRKIRAI